MRACLALVCLSLLAAPALADGPKAPLAGQDWEELSTYWDGRDVFFDAADIHLYRADKSIVTAHAATIFPSDQADAAPPYRALEQWFYFDCSGKPSPTYANGGEEAWLGADGKVLRTGKMESIEEHRLNDDVAAYDLDQEICGRVAKGEGRKFF